VLLSVQPLRNNEEAEGLKARLRGTGDDLPQEVLPDHRIVQSRSAKGRVAFVRQLARVEFVLDFDPVVQSELGRFGFVVIMYNRQVSRPSSPLVNLLLSG